MAHVTEKREGTSQYIHLKAYVPAEVYDAVRQAAFTEHVSLSEWVRRAIARELKEGREPR
jgi:predicted HicB family RNase H-like nuclease